MKLIHKRIILIGGYKLPYVEYGDPVKVSESRPYKRYQEVYPMILGYNIADANTVIQNFAYLVTI